MEEKERRLILRADDLGLSRGVNDAIEQCVKEGLIRSVGWIVNLPASASGLRLIDGCRIALGLHVNLSVGKPCADPKEIPSLLREDGTFHTSSEYRKARQEGRDLIARRDAIIEIEAQYRRFQELTGRDPIYIDMHAVPSIHFTEAVLITARKHHIPWNTADFKTEKAFFNNIPMHVFPSGNRNKDYDPFAYLKHQIETNFQIDVINEFVCHPGYVDQELLQHSSLTFHRAKEAEMLCSKELMQYLKDEKIHLISFQDLLQ